MATDLSLVYDPLKRRCDLVYTGRDIALDPTPATPMLLALLADAPARPGEVVPGEAGPGEAGPGEAGPGGGADRLRPASLTARRHWPGIALDRRRRPTGSRLWLLRRAKQTEATRRLAEDAAADALGRVERARGIAIALRVWWVRAGVLGIRAVAGATQVDAQRALGGA